jgi:SAM-dependent methyltransferase
MTYKKKSAKDLILEREWFYEFQLQGRILTKCYLPDDMKSIHHTRERMLIGYLNEHVGSRWNELRCLDIACHEGYFSLMLGEKGCREVIGIDAREEHIKNANLLKDFYGLHNVIFQQKNLYELHANELGKFDIVLLFGILYHIPDILGVLRIIRSLTKELCIIETQIAPETEGYIEWGKKENVKQIEGCLAIVDESIELSSNNKEAAINSISLVPSRKALMFLLEKIGFKTVEIISKSPDTNEQLARGKRIMLVASKK